MVTVLCLRFHLLHVFLFPDPIDVTSARYQHRIPGDKDVLEFSIHAVEEKFPRIRVDGSAGTARDGRKSERCQILADGIIFLDAGTLNQPGEDPGFRAEVLVPPRIAEGTSCSSFQRHPRQVLPETSYSVPSCLRRR